MKKQTCIIILLIGWLLFGSQSPATAQTDTLKANRYITRATLYGAGFTNVYDTYLSPQEYKGVEFRLSRETMRMTKLLDGNVSVQNLLQVDVSYTHNRVQNNNQFTGMINWNYGLHYQFRITPQFKILAGALIDTNLGFIYNLRNTNNPASARAFVNLDASAMAIWHTRIKNYPLTLRYQANLPFVGAMFSPHYGQSYYEIFSLGNSSGVVQFTSFHNQPSLRQFLSVDFPIRYAKMRIAYVADLQQSDVNGLQTHVYSHIFMIGFVKELYQLRTKNGSVLPPSISAY